MKPLKSVQTKDIYSKYIELKTKYKQKPSFYFDIATYMFQKSLREEGLRVISNLAELELKNPELLRALGRKLFEYKYYDEAIFLFNEVLENRPFEPHSYIDLGMAYAEKGDTQKAIEYLYKVIEKNWDADIINRFNGIELIVIHDINNIIWQSSKTLDTSFIEDCFLKDMPVDIRIVIDWDVNDTDIDLMIKDSTGEVCSYSNKETHIGGKISNDITQGYGPEEFRLKKAISGAYTIIANFYGTNKQSQLGKVTVRAFIYTDFNTKSEKKQILTLQLSPEKRDEYTIGEIEFKK